MTHHVESEERPPGYEAGSLTYETDHRFGETVYPARGYRVASYQNSTPAYRTSPMQLVTVNKQVFELTGDEEQVQGRLAYTSPAFDDAVVETNETLLLNSIATGLWIIHGVKSGKSKLRSRIRVETGSVISVKLISRKSKYLFKRSMGWRLRFSLSNAGGDDILTLIPLVNWSKESHDYVLQVNDEYETECDSFLILQAVHCANVSMSMMTGGPVPALVNL